MGIKLREEPNGAVVYQATEEPQPKSNIYCEIPWCSADGKLFVYQRMHENGSPNTTEYVACEFGTWKQHSLGRGLGGPFINHSGIFGYRRIIESDRQELVRIDLASGKSTVLFDFPAGFHRRTVGRPAISTDERYYAYGVNLSYDPQMFGIELFDLTTGEKNLIHTDPFICNPHTQFEPSESRQVMVQHNRGCRYLSDGTRVLLGGPEGTSEFLLDIPDGNVTRLQFGPPFTPRSTGHEAWIGDTKEILVSVGTTEAEAREKGNLYLIKAGAPPRIVSRGYRFVHVNTSVCGRFFSCDDRPTAGVVVGSIQTGKNAFICRTETSFGSEQPTHPHPYLSPDLKWVVYNSDRTGVTQIHAVRLPDGLMESLDAA